MCGQCSPGTYISFDLSCANCSPGTYSNITDSSACYLCSGGTFQAFSGMMSCVECSPGTYQAYSGSTSCALCSAETYQSFYGMTSCVECSPGTYQAFPGMPSCVECAAGSRYVSEYPNSQWCIECYYGTYQPYSGSTSCVECSSGTYQARTGSTSCALCSAGTYQAFSGSSSCVECSPGTYQAYSGTTSCVECSSGTYQTYSGMSSCVVPNLEIILNNFTQTSTMIRQVSIPTVSTYTTRSSEFFGNISVVCYELGSMGYIERQYLADPDGIHALAAFINCHCTDKKVAIVMTAAWSSELLWFFDSINAVPTSDFAESTCMNIAMIIEFDYVRTDMTGGSYIGQVLAESWSQAEGNASVVYTFQEGARNEVKIEAFSRSFVLESTLSSTDMLSIYSGIQATTQAVFSKSRTTDPSYQHLPGLHYLVVRGMNQYDLGEGGLNQSIFYSGSSIFEAPDFRFVSTLDGQRTLASMIRSLSSGQDAIAICTPFIPFMTDDLLAVLTEMGSDVSISQAPTAWCFFGVWGQPWHMRESFGETTMPSDYCIRSVRSNRHF